jgi:hypothetical protein
MKQRAHEAPGPAGGRTRAAGARAHPAPRTPERGSPRTASRVCHPPQTLTWLALSGP